MSELSAIEKEALSKDRCIRCLKYKAMSPYGYPSDFCSYYCAKKYFEEK